MNILIQFEGAVPAAIEVSIVHLASPTPAQNTGSHQFKLNGAVIESEGFFPNLPEQHYSEAA